MRRGGADLRATLGALREVGPSDRGLYNTAPAAGTGRRQWSRRRPLSTESVGSDFSRNRVVARLSKSRACALQRRPAAQPAREGGVHLASVKASAASSPRHHERNLSEDRGDRSRGKRRSRRFPPGPSASPLRRCRSSGVPSAASGPGFRPSATGSHRPLSLRLPDLSPLAMQPPSLSSSGPGLSASISQLSVCSASPPHTQPLANARSGFPHVSILFLVSCFSRSHTICSPGSVS